MRAAFTQSRAQQNRQGISVRHAEKEEAEGFSTYLIKSKKRFWRRQTHRKASYTDREIYII